MGGGEDGLLIVDTFNIMEQDEVDFRVVIRKGDRIMTLNQQVRIALGQPPDIAIQWVGLRLTDFHYLVNTFIIIILIWDLVFV